MKRTIHGMGRRALQGLTAAGLVAAAACNTDRIVTVNDPNQLTPTNIDNAGAVPSIALGALRQFVGGYDGFGDDAFLVASAAISDEFYYGDTFLTRQTTDGRSLQPPIAGNLSDAAFTRLQQARLNARRAYAASVRYNGAADAPRQALMRTIEGYVYVTMSEGWCGGVPFSVLPDSGTLDPTLIQPGKPLSTLAMNDTAIARFTQAIALDSTNNLARIGLGRALLNQGKFAQAAAAVSRVPTNYVYRLEHSANSGSENNPIFSLMGNGRFGISNNEGGYDGTSTASRPDRNNTLTLAGAEGLPFRAANDPRISYQLRGSSGACFTSSVRCFLNLNYRDFDADVPLASGIEARLIEAEAALAQNGGAGFTTSLQRLNDLRANSLALIPGLYPGQNQVFLVNGGPAPLAALTDPGTDAGRRDLVFRERAFWLFNTGHRQGDLRRLVRNYGFTTQQAFPTGPNFRGGTYGDDVAFPLPFNETQNPNFSQNACSTTTA